MNMPTKTKNINEEDNFNRLGFYALLTTQFQGAFS
jgi:hypothetical protein